MPPKALIKTLPALLGLLLLITGPETLSRPEIVRAGLAYYSDDYVLDAGVNDLAEEKNIEEVYQFYTYYEARYDTKGRVILFKEYKRGNVILEEAYVYENDSDKPTLKTVSAAGEKPKTLRLENP
ncbi:MAG: hypothetical protein HOC23_09545 [Halieaceae bacterium]|jgi:hypothetical protein|nr:hypothetical protein [Halieaceae bacterium]